MQKKSTEKQEELDLYDASIPMSDNVAVAQEFIEKMRYTIQWQRFWWLTPQSELAWLKLFLYEIDILIYFTLLNIRELEQINESHLKRTEEGYEVHFDLL